MFLEFWKRKQAEIQYDWDVAGYELEEVRLCVVIVKNYFSEKNGDCRHTRLPRIRGFQRFFLKYCRSFVQIQ